MMRAIQLDKAVEVKVKSVTKTQYNLVSNSESFRIEKPRGRNNTELEVGDKIILSTEDIRSAVGTLTRVFTFEKLK